MLHAMRKRMGDDKGFTLIELMVVVLIIAILIAIAIPTFLGLRSRAQNRAAHSDLRNGLTAAKAFYTDADSFTGFTSAVAEGVEPALDWIGAATPAAGEVAIKVASGTDLLLVSLSQSGTFYGIGDVNGATKYCKGDVSALASCTGTTTAAWA